MIMRRKKRIIAWLLCICLCFGMISVAGLEAKAEEAGVATDSNESSGSQSREENSSGNNDTQEETPAGESGDENDSVTDENGNSTESDDTSNVENGAENGENSDQTDENETQQKESDIVAPIEIPCMDEEGNIYYITDDVSPVIKSSGFRSRAADEIVVNLRVKKNGSVVTDVTTYTEYGTGAQGYLYGQVGADAAYLGTEGGKIKFMISGVIGLVDASQVQLVYKNSVASVSSYYANGSSLIHKITTNMNSSPTSSLNVGPQQAYMSTGATYYSYDGHYFYTDYSRMLADYKNNTRANSINPNSPYYNYYQYLPLRSTTAYSASQLSSKINAKISNSSKMWNIGNSLVNHQNTYGVNALLAAGLAANESGWGNSSIAQSKNNLFGLNAVDSSPGASANSYSSPDACVRNFAEGWMSKRYLNPNNSNYYGGYFGNKASGINVKYASDPYWGEKAANIAWNLDSDGIDRYRYTLGIKDTMNTQHTDLNVRKDSNASSTKLFSTGNQSDHAFIVLEEENGFYKVQSDPVLNSGRTAINNSSGNYNFSAMYAFVSSDYVDVVTGDVQSNTKASVEYETHVQFSGWMGTVKNGATSGTEGMSRRLEAVRIQLKNAPYSGSIQYRAYAQSYGWMNWVSDNGIAGTNGESKRLEAIQIKLSGEMAQHYDIYYRVHAQNFGWMGWAKNGSSSGTINYEKRLEAIQIMLVEKGQPAPGSTDNAFKEGSGTSTTKNPSIKYKTHVQFIGWQDYVRDGALGGTTGQSKRLEGIQIAIDDKVASGSVRYKTHVQFLGWQDWTNEGKISGTTGRSLRLEAIQIELTGDLSNQYDVYYRVHSQFSGWLGWAKNGQKAGTAGYSRRLEGIEIKLVKKGGAAPGSTQNPYLER